MKTMVQWLTAILMIACTSGDGQTTKKVADQNTSIDKYILHPVSEPNQNAFTVLIPEGWLHEGGTFFIDPVQAGGPANSADTKVDFKVKQDQQGTVMIHWHPEIYRCDNRYMPAAAMFPVGSNYQGMQVFPVAGYVSFLRNHIFNTERRGVSNVQMMENEELPRIATAYKSSLGQEGSPFRYQAGKIVLEYLESGIEFQELLFTIIQDLGQLGGGMWINRYTFSCRAPKEKYNQFEPLFQIINQSVRLNTNWLISELRNRARREGTIIQVNQHIHEISNQIGQSHQKTQSDIHFNVYKVLTEQEEYVNPFTNEVEMGTNQWNRRWQHEDGRLIYTDDINYDPTRDPMLQQNDGFKLSKMKNR
jgi:hypothetical protein